MPDRPKPPQGCDSWIEWCILRSPRSEGRDYAEAELAELREKAAAAVTGPIPEPPFELTDDVSHDESNSNGPGGDRDRGGSSVVKDDRPPGC